MVCVPAVEGDSFVNILSVMMNSSVNRLKRWEDNKLDFFGNSISLSGRVLDYLWQKNGMIAANIANNDTPGYTEYATCLWITYFKLQSFLFCFLPYSVV